MLNLKYLFSAHNSNLRDCLKKIKINKQIQYISKFKFSNYENTNNIIISPNGCNYIKPKLYADVNLTKEKEFYDYEKMNLKLG